MNLFRISRTRLGAVEFLPGLDFYVRPGMTDDLNLVEECLTQDTYGLASVWRRYPELKTMVDVGANIGITSRLLAQLWPTAQVLAVEPAADNLPLLRANEINGMRILPVAMGYGGPRCRFFAGRDHHTVGYVEHAGQDFRPFGHRHMQPVEVPMISLEAALESVGAREVDLLKLDCEGSEFPILENMRVAPRFITGEWHGADGRARVQGAIARLGEYRWAHRQLMENLGQFWAERVL